MERYKGIFTALLTPMHEDGSIDFESLAKHVERQLDAGIHGFYVGGSTAEGFILSLDERKQVLEKVVQASQGKATIFAHVGCISTEQSIELAKHAEHAGAHIISAVVPFYYKTGIQEIKNHYEAIMAATKLPMVIYHFPGATGINLSLDFYEEMARNKQCIGVKFTSLNLFEMEQIRARCGDEFLIYNGHDEVYAAGALMGADGAIGSTFNMMAGLFVSMFEAVQKGDWASVRSQQAKANEIISHMLRYDVIPYEKAVVQLQGSFNTARARMPLKQLTADELASIQAYYESNEDLKLK